MIVTYPSLLLLHEERKDCEKALLSISSDERLPMKSVFMADVRITVRCPFGFVNSSCCLCCLNIIKVKGSCNQTYNRFPFETARQPCGDTRSYFQTQFYAFCRERM